MILLMSETPEPTTGPVVTTPPREQPAVHVTSAPQPRRSGRLTTAAAAVGIVAGVVFIVAVVFFSGFVLGQNSASHRGGGPGPMVLHRGGPPPMMLPMGPRAEFERPFPAPFGPGMAPQQPGQPDQPDSPTTTAPARP